MEQKVIVLNFPNALNCKKLRKEQQVNANFNLIISGCAQVLKTMTCWEYCKRSCRGAVIRGQKKQLCAFIHH